VVVRGEIEPGLPTYPMTFRRAINRLHLWLGLVSALPVLILSITGAVLVFEEELVRFEHRRLGRVMPDGGERLPLEASWAAIRTAYPTDGFTLLRLPQAPEHALVALARARPAAADSPALEPRLVFANPYTARIVGERPLAGSVVAFVRQLHVSLVAGTIGQLIVTISTGIFLAILASGLVLWFKRGGGWRRLLIKWDARGKRFHYDLHANFGFYSFVFLFVIGLSGLLIGIGAPWRDFILKATDSTWREIPKLAAPVAATSAEGRATLDALLAAADRASPETRATQLVWPAKPDEPVKVFRRFSWGSRPTLHVSLHPLTAEVTDIDDPRRYDSGHLIHRLNRAIHSGDVGGPIVRVLWFVASLVPVFLLWTGLKLWRKPRRPSAPPASLAPPRTLAEREKQPVI
jgi:uncharacterized iron-regulated membrane protein